VTAEETVDTFIAAIERRDVDGAMPLLAPDCEYDNVPMGKAVGHAAIRATLDAFVTPSERVEFEVVRQVAAGSVVMNERIDRFELNGKSIEIAVAGVWEVVDGQITLWRDYFDLETFRRQT